MGIGYSDLKTALKERGLKVWFDRDDIRPGDRIVRALEQGIEQSRCAVLVVSSE